MEVIRGFVRDKSGHILIQALIIIPIIYIALFLPFSFAVVQHKRSVLDDVLDYSLQRAAVEGGLTTRLRQELLDVLEERGFDRTEISVMPASFVERVRGEIIEISIAVPGHSGILSGVKAIGGEPPPEDWQMSASGSIMSEKLP